jgi:hypothetical protein
MKTKSKAKKLNKQPTEVPCPLDLLGTYDEAHSLTLREVCEQRLIRGRRGEMASSIILGRWAKNGRLVRGYLVAFPAVKVHEMEYRVMPAWVTWHNRKVIELLNDFAKPQKIEIGGNPKREKKNAQAALDRLRQEGFDV